MLRRLAFLLCLSLVLVSVVPAGNASAAENGFVRFLHVIPNVPTVDVVVDGDVLLQNFSFQDVSAYTPLAGGSHTVEYYAPQDKAQPLLSQNINIPAGTPATVAVTGQAEDLHLSVYRDRTGSADDQASLRIIHLSPNAPSIDVSTVEGSPLFAGEQYTEATDYEQIPAGAVNLQVNPSGNPEAPIVAEAAFDLEPGKAYSAVVAGMFGVAPSTEFILLEDGIIPELPKSGMGGASPIVD